MPGLIRKDLDRRIPLPLLLLTDVHSALFLSRVGSRATVESPTSLATRSAAELDDRKHSRGVVGWRAILFDEGTRRATAPGAELRSFRETPCGSEAGLGSLWTEGLAVWHAGIVSVWRRTQKPHLHQRVKHRLALRQLKAAQALHLLKLQAHSRHFTGTQCGSVQPVPQAEMHSWRPFSTHLRLGHAYRVSQVALRLQPVIHFVSRFAATCEEKARTHTERYRRRSRSLVLRSANLLSGRQSYCLHPLPAFLSSGSISPTTMTSQVRVGIQSTRFHRSGGFTQEKRADFAHQQRQRTGLRQKHIGIPPRVRAVGQPQGRTR